MFISLFQLRAFERGHQRQFRWPHFDVQIPFVRVFHVSHKRTASHLHPWSSVRSSSNRSTLFKHLAFFVPRQRVSRGDFPSCLLLLLCLPFFRVAVVVVVLVVRVSSLRCVLLRVHLLQNAHWHIAVCIRECNASSSSCVSRSTTRSHAIVVFHFVILVTAHSLSYNVFCRPLIHFSSIPLFKSRTVTFLYRLVLVSCTCFTSKRF